MATNTEEIRRKLEAQANQRVNPLLKGLSMLTGGIAGELTGTNEQIRQQRLAKRALMEEQMSALQEERMMERMKAQQDEMLKRQLQIEEARNLAATRARILEARGQANVMAGRDVMGPLEPAEEAGMEIARANIARAEAERVRGLEATRPEMTGYLAAQGVQTGEPDIDTLQFLTAQQKTKEAMRKQDSLKMQLVTPSGSVVYGTYDELASKYPALIENITVAKTKESKPLDASFTESDGEIRFSFGPGVTPEQAAEYKKNVYKSLGVDAGDGDGSVTPTQKALPKGPPSKPGETPVVRGTGETRRGAAAAIAEEQAAPADMYGPLSPSEQFVQTGRRLGALEGRGGASTYGAQQTLTGPFYEAVASELGVQPKRVGQESAIVKSAKAVVASEFPTEAWNKLPQEIKNRIYIEALNRSAAQMAAPPKPSVFSSGYAESPFAPYSYSR